MDLVIITIIIIIIVSIIIYCYTKTTSLFAANNVTITTADKTAANIAGPSQIPISKPFVIKTDENPPKWLEDFIIKKYYDQKTMINDFVRNIDYYKHNNQKYTIILNVRDTYQPEVTVNPAASS